VLTVKGGERGQVQLNNEYWSNYGVAALTNAVRQTVGGDLDTGKLATDLANYNKSLLPALAASYYAVYSNGYRPTADALNALKSSGQLARANTELCERIADGQFTANINQAIAMGGDSSAAAAWFLFNLWVTLNALGNTDVDGAIRRFQQLNLSVPPQLAPGSWWSGGYASWWAPLSGSDVVEAARARCRLRCLRRDKNLIYMRRAGRARQTSWTPVRIRAIAGA
jgi:hypothetical protein